MSDDINPLEHPPLYEGDQIITQRDLVGVRNGWVLMSKQIPWYMIKERMKYANYIGALDILIGWLNRKKPVYWKGVYDAQTDTFTE